MSAKDPLVWLRLELGPDERVTSIACVVTDGALAEVARSDELDVDARRPGAPLADEPGEATLVDEAQRDVVAALGQRLRHGGSRDARHVAFLTLASHQHDDASH